MMDFSVASELAWASGLPNNWRVVPLKSYAKLGTGHTPDRNKKEYWRDCDVPWVTTTDVTRRADSLAPLHQTEQHISELGMANSAAVLHPAGTVMLSRTASIGYSVLIGQSMATTQAFVTWTPGNELDSRYLLLVLRAMKPEWDRLAYGSTHRTIYMPDLESVRIPLPPLEEQRRIADFLDAEVSRIDRMVNARSSQLAIMMERLRCLAGVKTGRVLLHSADSGDSKCRVQLRRAINSVQTGGTPKELLDPADAISGLPWYTPTVIDGFLSVGSAEKVFDGCIDDVAVFPAGSILIAGIGESLGKIGYLGHVATGNQQLTAIVPREEICGRFLAWQLWVAQPEIRDWAQYSRIRIINNDVLKAFPIWLPSLDVQQLTSRELDFELERVIHMRRHVATFLALMDERRQALITAAVTGQFDVTTASGRNLTQGV